MARKPSTKPGEVNAVELDIIRRLVNGKSQKEIAAEDGKTIQAVSQQLRTARVRTGSSTTEQLVYKLSIECRI
jgi:DNA-binding CsgD family transcriptional regulator